MEAKQPVAIFMTWKRRLARGGLVALGVALAAALLWWLLAPREVEVTRPVRGPAVQAVYATGTVEPSIEVRIAPRVGGRLIELRADEGDRVEAGAVLARLEDRDQRANVEQLQARLVQARQQYNRVTTLAKQGWVTRAALDEAQANYDAARALLEQAQEQLHFMWLRAPTDGTIIRREGEVGDFIPINETVFYMATANSPVRISAEVDEEDVPLVRVGQKVLVRADAFPENVFDGTVNEITPRGDPVARSYRVRVVLPDDTPLRFGMTAEINVITARRENALLVPASALDGNRLWVVEDGRLSRREVKTGVRGAARVEILEGIAPDALVVVTTDDKLRDGRKVRVRQVSPEAAPSGPLMGQGSPQAQEGQENEGGLSER